MATKTRLTGWGRTAPTTATVVTVEDPGQLADLVRAAGRRGVLARGLGRSYGDAAQNAGGTVLDMTRLDRIHRVDADTGLVDVDAGISLDELMRRMLPFGLWVPVLPGTRQVTVGGAIAADVHGKNHHVAGSFGNHVRRLELLLADGTVHSLTPDDDEFWATVGGMGLTGVILRATLALHPTESAYFVVDTERTADLDELMSRLSDGDEDYTYSVAWFDSVAAGSALGRAVITRGRSASRDELPAKLRRDPLAFDAPRLGTAPAIFPSGLLNKLTVRAFNELWYRKAPARRTGEVQNITTFFHPLDVVGEWNRIYGPRGFLQYQFVVPFGAEDTFRRCVQTISASRAGVVPERAEAVRRGQPGTAVVPDARLDAGRRPAGPPRAWTGCAPRWTSWCWPPAGGCTWPRTPGSTRTRSPRMYPRLDEWRKVRDALDPPGCSPRISPGGLPLTDRRCGKSPVGAAARRDIRDRARDRRCARSTPPAAGRAGRPAVRTADRGGRPAGAGRLRGGDRRVRRAGAGHPSRGGPQGVRRRRHRLGRGRLRPARRPGAGLDRRGRRRCGSPR